MDCPECGHGFSIVAGRIVHGKRVRRPRLCVVCRAEWQTVEITAAEHARLERAEAARRQVARLWEEK